MQLQKVVERKAISTLEKEKKQELSFLHVTLLHDLIYVLAQHFLIITKRMRVMACTKFRLQGT